MGQLARNIVPTFVFSFRTVLEKLTAYGHRFGNIVIAKRLCLHLTKVRRVLRNITLIVCFNTRKIYAWQTIRTHKTFQIELRQALLINALDDSKFKT